MYLMIRQDIRQLVHDAQKVQRALEKLEQDHEVWAREREQYDLMQLIKYVNRLESDVCMMQSDCMSMCLSYQEDGSWLVLDSLHRVYATLNILFDDLEKVRTELKEAYIYSHDLKQLEIDWGRCRKSVNQIRKYIQDGKNILKAKNVLLASDERKNVWFSTAQ